jgi:DNA-binding MarR family transcriptional regulator
MKLKALIKSKGIANPHQNAMLNITHTSNWIAQKLEAFFKPYGITHQQYNALQIVQLQLPNLTSVTNIRDRLLDKMSDASRIVDRLKKIGLIEKSISIKDKRRVHIVLTKKGSDLLNIIEETTVYSSKMMEVLSLDEVVLLNNILNKLRN